MNKGIVIAVVAVVIVLIVGAAFLFLGKNATKNTAIETTVVGNNTTTNSAVAGALDSLQCESVVPQAFLESTFGKTVNYNESKVANTVGKTIVSCNYETIQNQNGNAPDLSGGGGGITIAEANIANYENGLNMFQSQKQGTVVVTNDVGLKSFTWLVVSKMPNGPDLKQIQYHFITSDSKYDIMVLVVTHDGKDPTAYAKAIAQEVNSHL